MERHLLGQEALVAIMRQVMEGLGVADGDPVPFRLVGTAAALAQGVMVPTRDVDLLLASRHDLDRFAVALAGFRRRTSPTWIAESEQYFARFEVEGVDVELSTVERLVPTDTWECAGVGPWRHHVLVDIGQHVVPAVSLELRLVTELVRGREDRYEPLINYLHEHGADRSLVERSMRDRGVGAALRQHVADRLRPR
jgi:hypothetical protein